MSSTVQKCLQAMGQRFCLAAVFQSQHLKPKIELLVGILVYDTGFPFQSGNSREPGFESRRPHHVSNLRSTWFVGHLFMSNHITYYLYSIIRQIHALHECGRNLSLSGSDFWINPVCFSLSFTLNTSSKGNYTHHIARGK